MLFSQITEQSRKGILPFSLISLVNWMLVLFVQMFVEFLDFVFVYSSCDRIVNVLNVATERECFTVGC